MKSKLAKTLTIILESDRFIRDRDWNDFLLTTNKEIKSWLNDETIPDPHQLKRIEDIITSLNIEDNKKIVNSYLKLLGEPTKEVTQIEIEFDNLRDYINSQQSRM